jgi:hypothetical protein
MIATMVIPDVFVANCWMAVLLYCSVHQFRIDRWTRANATAIRELEQRLESFQQRVAKIPSLPDLIIILAFGFAVSWACFLVARQIDEKLESSLTVEAVRLVAPQESEADAFASIRREGEGEERHTYLVLENVAGSPAPDAAADSTETPPETPPGFTTRSESVATAKLEFGAARMQTVGDLVHFVNAEVPGWEARWIPGMEAHTDVGIRQLRGVAHRAVAEDGLVLRIPDPARPGWWQFRESFGATTWKFILVTTVGVLLSFTPARRLDGAGASKIGSVMIYLLVACIGAHADFTTIGEQPAYILMGFIWMACHVIMLLGVALLIRAPIFFVAVGSQANIGGAASAPVVAAAFHPSLAPVGALLAVAGYVLGTYAGLVCMTLLKMVAGG